MDIAELRAIFSADTRSFDDGANRVNRELSQTSGAASSAGSAFDNFGSKLSSAGGSMQSFGATLTAAITLPLAAAAYKILQAGTDYDAALNMFGAVSGATAAQMQKAADTAKALGADISLPATSAKDAALAMSELAKAGLSANESMTAARGVLQLAAAGQLDEARAAEITANALNTFSLQAAEAGRVSDVLAAAANASSAGVSDIAAGFQQAGASFAAAKLPIEDLATAIGVMANAGIKGSDAGTSLKTFLSSIQAPSAKGADAMKELGVKVFDAAGHLKGMPEIVGAFSRSLAGLSDEAKVGKIQAIFGADASRAAQILFKEGEDGFNKMKSAISQTGAAASLAGAMTKGLGGAWSALQSQLETIGIDIYNSVKAPLEQITSQASATVGRIGELFAGLSDNGKIAVVAFAAIAAVIPPVIAIVGTVAVAVGSVITALGTVAAFAGFAGIGAAFSAILPFIVPVVAAVAAVGVAAVALYAAWQTNFGGIQETTQTVFNAVKNAVSTAMDAVSGVVTDIGGGVLNWWRQNYPLIHETVATVSNAIKATVANFLAAIKGFWEAHGGQISGIVKSIWDTIKAIVTPVMQIIGNVIKLGMQVINGDWSGAWNTLLRVIQQSVQAAVAYFRELQSKAGSVFISLVTAIGKASVDVGIAMLRGIKDGVVWVVEMFASLPSKILAIVPRLIAAGSSIGKAVWDGIKGGLSGAQTAEPLSKQLAGKSGAFGSSGLFDKYSSPLIPASPFLKAPPPSGGSFADMVKASGGAASLDGIAKSATGTATGVASAMKSASGHAKSTKDHLKDAGGHAKTVKDHFKEINELAAKTWKSASLAEFAKNQGFTPLEGAVKAGHNANSLHYQGLAQDVRSNGKAVDEIVRLMVESLKSGIRVVDERIRPAGQKVWGGANIHLEENDRKPSFFNPKLDYGGKLEQLKALDFERMAGRGSGVAEALSSINKQANPAMDALKGFADELARMNVTTREAQTNLDITSGKFGSLTPAMESALLASARLMDSQSQLGNIFDRLGAMIKNPVEEFDDLGKTLQKLVVN